MSATKIATGVERVFASVGVEEQLDRRHFPRRERMANFYGNFIADDVDGGCFDFEVSMRNCFLDPIVGIFSNH